jgi:hypothetical protein
MMMIDRKTAQMCAALIALMLAAAVARIVLGSPIPATQAAALLPQFFSLPFIAAILVASLYHSGRRAIAIETEVQPRFELGKRLTIGLFACMLLIQGLQIFITLDLQVPAPVLAAVGCAIVLKMVSILLRAINQLPKLRWFEHRGLPAGELGPIYGPRYMRAHARIWIVCLLAAMAGFLALPMRAWFYIPLALPLVQLWTMGLLLRYSRKWKLDRSTAPGVD